MQRPVQQDRDAELRCCSRLADSTFPLMLCRLVAVVLWWWLLWVLSVLSCVPRLVSPVVSSGLWGRVKSRPEIVTTVSNCNRFELQL